MKRIYIILGVIACLLSACEPETDSTNQPQPKPTNQPEQTNQLYQLGEQSANAANCPEETKVELTSSGQEENPYSLFNFHILKIIPEQDTIRFQARNYDFVFCRGDSSWTVQPGTFEPEPPLSQEESIAQLTNPPYETVELDGDIYQYRVNLQPNPFPNYDKQPQEVVFELITPEQEEPQVQTLYTLEQLKEAEVGFDLGVPRVTAAVDHENRLFWSVAAEQGEGFSGIATIVSYDAPTQQLQVIQPEKINSQQITNLVTTGEGSELTFWLTTKVSGEGSPDIPGMGLVAYRPESDSVSAYHVRNSPLVGAIPGQLELEDDLLWIGTGNGVCALEWQAAQESDSWHCWQFAARAEVPSGGVPIYPTLLSNSPAQTYNQESVEVLWWSPIDQDNTQGRYEVAYNSGFSVTLDKQGIYREKSIQPDWFPPAFWAGNDWHWNGERFVRGFDEVSLNFFGGGPMGISINQGGFDGNQKIDTSALRGDLELLEITEESTKLKYYSGWVEDSVLKPYVTVEPHQLPKTTQPNPLK